MQYKHHVVVSRIFEIPSGRSTHPAANKIALQINVHGTFSLNEGAILFPTIRSDASSPAIVMDVNPASKGLRYGGNGFNQLSRPATDKALMATSTAKAERSTAIFFSNNR